MECLHLPKISFDEFAGRLFTPAKPLPLTGSVEVTARCNLNCVHCYINLPAAHQEAGKGELGYLEWRRIIDEMVAEGCLWLLFTGGEIFLRPDFLDIYLYAKRQGLLVTLFTNGTLITPAVADVLAEFPPYKVEITIYGRTPKTHEAVTRVPGSYEQCLKGIQLLLERKISLSLKTMIMTLNQHELEEMKGWMAELGLEFRYDPVLSPRIDGSKKPCTLRITPEQVIDLDLADEKRLNAWQEFIKDAVRPPADSENLYHCSAGEFSFHIDPYASLSTCMMVRTPCYSLHSGTFAEGWQRFILQARQQKRRRDNPCAGCDAFPLCDICPGWAQLELGEPEGRVNYLCEIARLRARALGMTSQN